MQHRLSQLGVTALSLVLALTFAIAPLTVSAQTQTQQPTTGGTQTTTTGGAQTQATPPAAPSQNPTDPGTGAADQATGDHQPCTPATMDGCVRNLIKWVALFFLTLAGVFLGIVGLLFNWTIYITVFQFGNVIGNNAGMLAAWTVLRDIGNILLLFGFIFMGVSTILNLPGNEFTAKRALPTLIIFAILLNFSLFAAEAIIDVSNGIATSFYSQAGNGLCPSTETNPFNCIVNYGVAGGVLQMSGITRIFDFSPASTFGSTNSYSLSIAIIGLTLFAATMAMVLLAAVFMLIARACMLAVLMAVSPIGFAGMAIPPLQRFAKMWWDQILKQAFFAPIYLLLILISIRFMDGVRTALSVGDSQNLVDAFTASGVTNLGIVIVFILLIGFLLMATRAAQSMSAVGATASTKWAGAAVFGGMARITNGASGTVFQGTRIVGREVTRRASKMNASTPLGRALQSGLVSVGTGITSASRAGQRINTDVRNIPIAGSALQRVAGGPAEHATFADMQHQLHDVREGMNKSRQESITEANRVDLAAALRSNGGLTASNERFLAGLSADQIAADHGILGAIEKNASLLSSEQFDGLMKSDKVSQTIKEELAETRFHDQEQIASLDPDGAFTDQNRDLIRRMSKKDLASFAKYRGEDFAKIMAITNASGDTLTSGSQNDSLEENEALTRGQRELVRNSTRRGKVGTEFEQAAGGEAAAVGRMTTYANALGPKEKNKLGGNLFTFNDAAQPDRVAAAEAMCRTLTSDDMREFMRDTKFTDLPERQRVLNRALAGPRAAEIRGYVNADQRTLQYWTGGLAPIA